MDETGAATLFIVATPLGNPADLSPRASEVLGAVDAVLAEDTRRTGLLLKTLGVTARRLVSFHEHNEEARLPQVLAMLAEGQDVALVSDAGPLGTVHVGGAPVTRRYRLPDAGDGRARTILVMPDSAFAPMAQTGVLDPRRLGVAVSARLAEGAAGQ